MIDDFHKSVMRGLKKPLTTISHTEKEMFETNESKILHLTQRGPEFILYYEGGNGSGSKFCYAKGTYQQCLRVAVEELPDFTLINHVKVKKEMKNFDPNKKPNVEYAKKLLEIEVDVDSISKPELINLLETYPDGFFNTYNGEQIKFNYSRYETEFEYEKRIAQEKIDFGKWEEDYKKWQNINDPDKKFKDPEYIEYLRLRKKIKEKGYPLEPKSKEKY